MPIDSLLSYCGRTCPQCDSEGCNPRQLIGSNSIHLALHNRLLINTCDTSLHYESKEPLCGQFRLDTSYSWVGIRFEVQSDQNHCILVRPWKQTCMTYGISMEMSQQINLEPNSRSSYSQNHSLEKDDLRCHFKTSFTTLTATVYDNNLAIITNNIQQIQPQIHKTSKFC